LKERERRLKSLFCFFTRALCVCVQSENKKKKITAKEISIESEMMMGERGEMPARRASAPERERGAQNGRSLSQD
jgi:hypothetical protein